LVRQGAVAGEGELPGWQRLICRTEPGEGYARTEVGTAMEEYARGRIGARLAPLMPERGVVGLSRNPEIEDPQAQRGEAIYLYRMSATAAERRVEWLQEIGRGVDGAQDAFSVLGDLW